MIDILYVIVTVVLVGLGYYGCAMLGIWLSEKWWYRKLRAKKGKKK